MQYDCVIIGSGVAGLSSALYLARAKKSVMIIEDSVLGGTTATLDKIENYPGFVSISGFELIQNMIKQVSSLGVNIDFMQIKSIDFDNKQIKFDNSSLEYKSLIIASGLTTKKLNLPEEKDFQFRGLSYCAICDGNLYKNKKIVVVTDGYSAKESIDYLANLSDDITIIDKSDKFKSDKFRVINNSKVTKINGQTFVSGVDVHTSSGEQLFVDCDGLFVSLGKETNLSLFKDRIDIKDDYILSDENMHTNLPGVFVAGDIRYKSLRQIVTACADGAIAGTEAIKYIQQN